MFQTIDGKTFSDAKHMNEEELKERVTTLLEHDELLTSAESLWLEVLMYFLELKYEVIFPFFRGVSTCSLSVV